MRNDESYTGDQLPKDRRWRGMWRSPSWKQVDAWRSHWNEVRVRELCKLFRDGVSNDVLVEATGRPPITMPETDNGVIKLPDLRGFDLAVLPPDERRQFKPTKLNVFQHARLDGARLTDADLSHLNLSRASLAKATLRRVDFAGALLTKANLRDADLRDTRLDGAHLGYIDYTTDGFARKGTILMETHLERAKYVDPVMERDARDQYYLYVLKHRCRKSALARFGLACWRLSSNYGRSFSMWAICCLYLITVFALKFYNLGPSAFEIPNLDFELGTMFYYSVVTFTTLGFGDITPKTGEAAAWIVGEVVLGYIMLGGLIAILAQKVARQS